MNSFIDKYTELMEYEFKDTFKYADTLEEANVYKISFSGLKDLVENGTFAAIHEWQLPWLFEIAMYHYEYSLYASLHLNNEELSKKHLSLATSYASVSLECTSQSYGCYERSDSDESRTSSHSCCS